MDFINVTDVNIPEGNCTKIAETVGGRVLWQKKYSPVVHYHWEIMDFRNDVSQNNYYERAFDVVDTGNGVEFFCKGSESNVNDNNYSRPTRRFHMNKDGSYGDVYTLWRGTKIQSDDLARMAYHQLSSEGQQGQTDPLSGATGWGSRPYSADIDPETKIWCVAGNNFYATNSSSPVKWKSFPETPIGAQLCCWSPELKRFCLTNSVNSVLVDTSGNVTGVNRTDEGSNANIFGDIGNLIWSSHLRKFIVHRGDGSGYASTYTRIRESSDGLNWNNIDVNFSGGIADKLGTVLGQRRLCGICWMDNIGKFVMAGKHQDNYYVYMSTDLRNWTYVYTLENLLSSSGSNIPFDLSLAYSSKKQVLLLTGPKVSYLTRDLVTWIKVPYASGMMTGELSAKTGWTKWSDSLNAFIRIYGFFTNTHTVGKLVIDN